MHPLSWWRVVLEFSYSQNTNYGTGSGTQGDKNAFFGYYAGNATRYDRNTAMGWKALLANTIGYANTAIGAEALSHTTTGQFNTAIGDLALLNLMWLGDSILLLDMQLYLSIQIPMQIQLLEVIPYNLIPELIILPWAIRH